MYCVNCGSKIEGNGARCASCGQAIAAAPARRWIWLIPAHILGVALLVAAAFLWGKGHPGLLFGQPVAPPASTAAALVTTSPETPPASSTAALVTTSPETPPPSTAAAVTTTSADTPPAVTATPATSIPDDTGIVFKDKEVEAWIRANYVKRAGPITSQDMILITSFEYDPVNDKAAKSGAIKTLDDLKHCVNLEYLRILKQPIGDIECLRGLNKLNTIFLSYSNVTDLSPLAGKERLEWVWISSCPIEDMSPVLALPNLMNFNGEVTDVSALKNSKNLRHFYSSKPIEDITPLFGHENLESVRLMGITDDEFKAMLGSLKQLRSIDIESSFLQDESLKLLSNYPLLDNLILNSCGIRDISGLSFLKNVNDLRLTGNAIEDISPLSGLTMVSYCLDLRRNKITDYAPLKNAKIKHLWVDPGAKSKIFAVLEKNGCTIYKQN